MKCLKCHHLDTKVVDSRLTLDGFSIRRRRECLKCGFRYSTLEEVEILGLTIIKSDGNREAYNKEKMEKGIKKSLEKRPVTDEEFKKLVNQIEIDLQKTKKREIKSSKVGEVIIKRLKRLDKVAYIRFASVYKSFKDPETFRKEINELLKVPLRSRRSYSKKKAANKVAKMKRIKK